MYKDAEPSTVEIAEIIAECLRGHFSLEIRSSVVHTRIYMGVSDENKDEHFIIQIDKN